MYSTGAAEAWIFLALIVIWLGVLSFLLWKEYFWVKRLFPKDSIRDIRNKFRDVLEELEKSKKQGEGLRRTFKEFYKEGLGHIQKMKILRYNPYSDTGGNQSFSIAFLDGKLNGLILTSLHSRAGTRIYTKQVVLGKGEVELSKEENEVLKKAIND